MELYQHARNLSFTPVHLLFISSLTNKGEDIYLHPIIKGECDAYDMFVKDVLNLSNKIQVYHFNTSKILSEIDFVIGQNIERSLGDTCRMMFKLKQHGRSTDYFIWDGIVSHRLLNFSDSQKEFFYNKAELITGKTNFRMVLLEKTKKAP